MQQRRHVMCVHMRPALAAGTPPAAGGRAGSRGRLHGSSHVEAALAQGVAVHQRLGRRWDAASNDLALHERRAQQARGQVSASISSCAQPAHASMRTTSWPHLLLQKDVTLEGWARLLLDAGHAHNVHPKCLAGCPGQPLICVKIHGGAPARISSRTRRRRCSKRARQGQKTHSFDRCFLFVRDAGLLARLARRLPVTELAMNCPAAREACTARCSRCHCACSMFRTVQLVGRAATRRSAQSGNRDTQARSARSIAPMQCLVGALTFVMLAEMLRGCDWPVKAIRNHSWNSTGPRVVPRCGRPPRFPQPRPSRMVQNTKGCRSVARAPGGNGAPSRTRACMSACTTACRACVLQACC